MNILPAPKARLSPKHAGFSLVEVTLAIGIVAFAFMALFGLVPTGLNVFRSAIDTSIGTQIVQEVTQNAQQTDYQTLLTTPVTYSYYDEQGNQLSDVATGVPITTPSCSDTRSIYSVKVTATSPTSVPSASGSGSGNAVLGKTANIATLAIQIAKNPSHSSNPFTTANAANVNNFSAFVARNLSALESTSTNS